MKYFILFYNTVDNFVERRQPHRSLHLQHVKEAFDQGHLMMGGAFAKPPGAAAIIFKVDDVNIIQSFAREDPYVKHGLIKEWQIREWKVVIGN